VVPEAPGATASPLPAMGDADYRALARFRFALRVFLRFSEDAARAVGLTPNQHQLLLAIRGYPGGAPAISEVAEWLQLRHHSTVELVDRAVESGLVVRQVDLEDRRRQRLALTARGAELVAALSASHRDELRRFRDEMNDVLRELG
jgi:DNA-binding MarR family transcriptional regulator